MTPFEQLAGTLKAVMKKKLEQVVEDNILLAGKGKLTDLNLVQYEKLAREQGFTDVAKDLSDLVTIFGSSFIEHLRAEEQSKKQERNYPERRLEDYLTATPERLNLIEKGLKLVDRQYETRSGILDIFAKDEHDKNVIIELKMGKYDDHKVITQIEKYLNDKPDARLIFVAPYISSTVFYKFKPLVEKGQITFYKVAEKGQDYTITHEDGNAIPNSKKIEFKGRQNQDKPALYDIFTAKKQKSAPKRQRAISDPEKMPQKEIQTSKKTHYMLVRREDGLPGSVELTETQTAEFENLVSSPATHSALKELGIMVEKATDHSSKVTLAKMREAITGLPKEIVEKGMVANEKISDMILQFRLASMELVKAHNSATLTDESLNQLSKYVERSRSAMEKTLADPEYKKNLEFIAEWDKKIFGTTGKSILTTDNYVLAIHTAITEYLALKIQRVKKIAEFNRELAEAYLCRKMTPIKIDSTESITLIQNDIWTDNHSYAPIVNSIKQKQPGIEKPDITPESLKGKPLDYKVLAIARPFLANKEALLKTKITISLRDRKEIEQLGQSSTLEDALNFFNSEINKTAYFSHGGIISIADINTKTINHHEQVILGRSAEKIHNIANVIEKSETGLYEFFDCVESNSYYQNGESALAILKEINKINTKELVKLECDKDIHSAVEVLRKKIKIAKGADKRKLEIYLSIYSLADHSLYNKFLNVKIARAEKLLQLNEELGRAYLAFNPMMNYRLQNLESTGKYDMQNIQMKSREKIQFIQADNELYRQIIERFSAAPENGTTAQPAPKYATSNRQESDNPLQEALFREINGNASHEVKSRMDYFIQDASALLPPDKSAQLGEAFEQFKFARKFRKREIQPTDVKIRNFFDDVTLDIRKGTVPDADALERLYERA